MSSRDRAESSTPPSPPEVETSPPPSLPPSPSSPFFRAANPPPLDTTTGLSSESPDGPPSPLELGAGSGSDSPTSDSPGRGGKSLRALKASIKGAVQTAGGIAHQLLTREGTVERDAGLYLPDEDDVKAISEPLAGLASRRAPEAASNPDITDLIGLVIGLAGYAIKQQLKRAELARERYLEGTVQDLDADQAPEPVDA